MLTDAYAELTSNDYTLVAHHEMIGGKKKILCQKAQIYRLKLTVIALNAWCLCFNLGYGV